LIRILTGFQKPTSGSATVCGIDPVKDPLHVRGRIGYVSDRPSMYEWMTVSQIGWFTASFYPDGFLDAYTQLIDRYEISMQQKVKHLSKGQRAKVALSLSLAHDPELLILDEPTSGLDPMVRREFLESMVERAASGRTVFLSSHQISEVERVADTIAILHRGKLRCCQPINDLKASMSQITIGLDDPLCQLPALPEPAETLIENTQGRHRQIVARNFNPAMIAELENVSGVLSVSHRAMSLEEIFIAFTHGEGLHGEVSGGKEQGLSDEAEHSAETPLIESGEAS
ncbi:ABC transporter ATP-binding protein, partial [Novipirellula maiorica]|uniref:ABC transporter ATP-binding protein n=1 Tax=Novipirellula maiorica TaxID=1265734 RepID=UPI0005947792